MTPCEECRKAEARVLLSTRNRCTTQLKRLCDSCARAVRLPAPFTLTPLPPPPKS